ncbi:cell division/cell wall cluster transcriptional repressor MraZ [Prevotella amnii]|jgi:hypothetical protein|uniref:Transcriptional regulator MraZ n=3 Tax=Prevotella amnii TaxID=419005 RepID=A0A096D752_9BACT|nr:hypothetical protein [Prevotella amnii]EFN91910.1 putative protein MraZ [Prevotella amnii CRIS 21A-A]KGF53354.1 cell division protein MraZ [Prevotella amnii DNF00058]KXB77441.1 putative protein MraZ [Prevotella amnii]
MRFLGNVDARVDVKGRAFFPSTFRKILSVSGEESLIMRKDLFEPCLVLYPQSVWNDRLDTLRAKLSRWNKRDQMVYRQYVSDVEVITLDTNGRILIPKRYLCLANIEQEISFIGMDDSIEIWSKGNTLEEFMPYEELGKALEDLMEK